MSKTEPAGTKVVKFDEMPTTLTLHKCRLVVVEGISKGKSFILDKANIKIGSKKDCDLVLEDETISRVHCEIIHKVYQDQRTYILRDHESTNGTFLNDIRVMEAFLHPGAVIKLGKTEIKFLPIDEKIEIFPSKKKKFGDIIGQHLSMRRIYGILEKISPTDVTVIIEGETGSGKEMVAEAIHKNSRRIKKPFIVFDCSAVADNLIESELFGHEKGAFTGAVSSRQGAFELANGGTIFLDEIGELNLDLQPKLLRALEQRTVKRVGGDRHTKVDVRVICATNRNLETEVKENRFREDLYFRLSVVSIRIPQLKERREDIALLAEHFVSRHNAKLDEDQPKIAGIEPDALSILMNYNWPGNVRELKNAIERAITFCSSDRISVTDLPDNIRFKVSVEGPHVQIDESLPFKEAKDKWVESFEKEYLVNLLKRNNLNISKAAKEAHIDRKSIQRLLKKYNLNAKDL
ncbi:MAG: sigma 54-interacting transcriptional regulator [Pseudomonadota bacterium]